MGITNQENLEEKIIFNELIGRNALNWYSSFKGRVIDISKEPLEKAIYNVLGGRT